MKLRGMRWFLLPFLGALSCQTSRPGDSEELSRIRKNLQIQIPEPVEFRDAMIYDVVTYLDRIVEDRHPSAALNHMIVDHDWGTNYERYSVAYVGTNVTVGDVLSAATQQSGLVAEPLRGALFVGTPATLKHFRSVPPFIAPEGSVLTGRLETSMPEYSGCQANIYDVVAYVRQISGIPIQLDIEEGADLRLLFMFPNVRNMKYRDFLWWVANMSGADISVAEEKVRLRIRKPNPASQGTLEDSRP